MKSEFDYSEFVKFVNNMGVATEDFDDWLKSFLLQQAQRCVALCKERQRAVGAVDTGAMINSWSIGKEQIALKQTGGKSKSGKAAVIKDIENSSVEDISIIGDVLSVTIYNPMEYASFIEYGQRSYTGKYILTISINKIQKALPSRFDKAFSAFIKEHSLS